MSGSALFFVVLGVGVTVVNLMKLVTWLDTPRASAHRAQRRSPSACSAADLTVAELSLERARYSA